MGGLRLANNAATLSVSPAYPKISAQNPLRLLGLPYGSPLNLGGASTRRWRLSSFIGRVEWPVADTREGITWNT